MAKALNILMGTNERWPGRVLNARSTHDPGSSAITTATAPTTMNATENNDQLP
jgi:hypothetical protein